MGKFFPRQELAAKGLSPMAIAALERAYHLSDDQIDQISDLGDRLSAQEAAPAGVSRAEAAAIEDELLRLIGLLNPGPTHADIAALQAQINDLAALIQPPAVQPESAPDLMYPPSYN